MRKYPFIINIIPKPICMSLLTLELTPTTRYNPWSSKPSFSIAHKHLLMKLKPTSSSEAGMENNRTEYCQSKSTVILSCYQTDNSIPLLSTHYTPSELSVFWPSGNLTQSVHLTQSVQLTQSSHLTQSI